MLHAPQMLKLNAENYTLFVVAAKSENISRTLHCLAFENYI